jgi:prevent-host-death family protein
MSTDHITASRFKAQCLALLDEVARTGRPLIVTKRGRPVARVEPIDEASSLRGSVKFLVDEDTLIAPLHEDWDPGTV